MSMTRRDWMTLAAASPLAAATANAKTKGYAPRIACACYVFEQDYAKRKGMSLKEALRWLQPNLGFDPDAVSLEKIA